MEQTNSQCHWYYLFLPRVEIEIKDIVDVLNIKNISIELKQQAKIEQCLRC